MLAVLFISGCGETGSASSLSSDLNDLEDLNNEMNALDVGNLDETQFSTIESLL